MSAAGADLEATPRTVCRLIAASVGTGPAGILVANDAGVSDPPPARVTIERGGKWFLVSVTAIPEVSDAQ